MKLCRVPECRREAIPDGPLCDTHTRAALTAAFAPEWIRRAQEHRLPARVEGGRAA